MARRAARIPADELNPAAIYNRNHNREAPARPGLFVPRETLAMRSRSAPAPNAHQSARIAKIKAIGCIACLWNIRNPRHRLRAAPSYPTAHHLNEGDHHGGRRLGHDETVCLCAWHHQGYAPDGYTADTATLHFGPSWAVTPNAFREFYGNGDALLAAQNAILRAFELSQC